MKYCSKCGKQLPDEAVFCDECGTKLIEYKQSAVKQKLDRRPQKKRGSFFRTIIKLVLFLALIGFGYSWVRENFPELFEKKPAFTVPSVPGINTGNNNNSSNNNSSNNNNNNGNGNGLSIIPDGDQTSGQNLSLADFNFYEEYLQNGVPEGSVNVQGGYADGDWKYDIRVQTDQGYFYEELGMAFVDVEGESMRLELYPRYADTGTEIVEINDNNKYEPFTGGYIEAERSVKLVGNDMVIYISRYYAYEGREYMIASVWFSEEDSSVFLMTRGQN